METPPVHVAANPDTVDFTRQQAAESMEEDDDALSTVDLLDEDEERIVEASASRIARSTAAAMAYAGSSPSPPLDAAAATEEDEDEDEDYSAQATPLARTPMRRSLDMTALTIFHRINNEDNPDAQSEVVVSSAASILSESSSSAALEVPSLDPIPDEADVDEEDELTEHMALGLIDREQAQAVAARSSRRRGTITQVDLPSYSDSIGILG